MFENLSLKTNRLVLQTLYKLHFLYIRHHHFVLFRSWRRLVLANLANL